MYRQYTNARLVYCVGHYESTEGMDAPKNILLKGDRGRQTNRQREREADSQDQTKQTDTYEDCLASHYHCTTPGELRALARSETAEVVK